MLPTAIAPSGLRLRYRGLFCRIVSVEDDPVNPVNPVNLRHASFMNGKTMIRGLRRVILRVEQLIRDCEEARAEPQSLFSEAYAGFAVDLHRDWVARLEEACELIEPEQNYSPGPSSYSLVGIGSSSTVT